MTTTTTIAIRGGDGRSGPSCSIEPAPGLSMAWGLATRRAADAEI
jgi:hypothetical protein